MWQDKWGEGGNVQAVSVLTLTVGPAGHASSEASAAKRDLLAACSFLPPLSECPKPRSNTTRTCKTGEFWIMSSQLDFKILLKETKTHFPITMRLSGTFKPYKE
jgi:hypothetical protein